MPDLVGLYIDFIITLAAEREKWSRSLLKRLTRPLQYGTEHTVICVCVCVWLAATRPYTGHGSRDGLTLLIKSRVLHADDITDKCASLASVK